MPVRLKAPAKVNLSLLIGERREDGYHNIRSVFAAINLYDYITLYKRPGPPEVLCPLLADENIAWRAIDLFRKEYGINPEVEIVIEKHIPIGRGLGGGSSDGAAVLIGLHLIYNVKTRNLIRLGSILGSDVPFFFFGGLALISGRGDFITPLPYQRLNLLIVVPPYSISTRWAYRRLDEQIPPTDLAGRELSYGHNDFERIIFDEYPDLAKIKSWLIEGGATAALLSGSGSAVFGLFESRVPSERPFPGYGYYPARTIGWGVV